MLNKSYSYSKNPKYTERDTKPNKSLISFKNSKWKPKGAYNQSKAITKDIEHELKKIERVKREKMILDDRFYSTRKELLSLKNNHEKYIHQAGEMIRSYSNKLRHSSFNKEVVKNFFFI